MKFLALLSITALASVSAAQDLSKISKCGQMCINNMLALAPSLNCSAGDIACLCSNKNFGYGVRDCSAQACKGDDLDAIQSVGTEICKNAMNNGATSLTTALPTNANVTSYLHGSTGTGASGTAYSTRAISTGTITTSGTTFTSTYHTTLSSRATSGVVVATTITSGTHTITSSFTTNTDTTGAQATTQATGTHTTSGNAAAYTGAPVGHGLAGVLGIAALLAL